MSYILLNIFLLKSFPYSIQDGITSSEVAGTLTKTFVMLGHFEGLSLT
jgi:hypothetical protein